MLITTMPVTLAEPSHFFTIPHIAIACTATQTRYTNRDDLTIFAFPATTTMAGCFTVNSFAASPVLVAKKHLKKQPLGWVINAGNANAATGEQGLTNALHICTYTANLLGCQTEQILPFSTGIIGEQLPIDDAQHNPFLDTIRALAPQLEASSQHNQHQLWHKAAKAIMTTDTISKGISMQMTWEDSYYTLNAIAKGSGMICPNMATMLGFLVTNVAISRELLQEMLLDCVEKTFHCISIDGDTSTNDSVVVAATGNTTLPKVDDSPQLQQFFHHSLHSACDSLAQSIVRDGEGATRMLCIEVTGAHNTYEAKKIARTIAHSPLVKTALFAGDPNWGRIACAIGNAGLQTADIQKMRLFIGDQRVINQGSVDPNYIENQGATAFSQPEVHIRVLLERGNATTRFFTTDLSHQYVDINASYRS